ncbi:DUF402 domain-containing protein [Rhizohabitans arisaemae]|uniref:DUF402 domain-containing protein n=1 Tax=Rhizohabitans arisaemae TaxID=2720610 RepID=UPI0024B0AD88|nr:DUF402 domain-containing protein [Rhizohabitans arisaemae]
MTINVVYRKYDGSLHWHMTLRKLGEDEHGVWLGAPAGSTGQRGSEPPIVYTFPYVMLFPREGWWTASFNDVPHKTEIYCDVTTVPTWTDDQVTMIDLDLDVLRRRDGTVFIDDEDEFAEHRVRYSYPPEIVGGARTACAWLFDSVSNGAEPFASGYKKWLTLL